MRDYYLYHLGIERWVLRPPSKALLKPFWLVGETREALCSGSAGVLFNQMLRSISISWDQILVMTLSESLHHKFGQMQPRAILNIVHPSNQHPRDQAIMSSAAEAGIELVNLLHPAYLLEHPLEKKQAYHALYALQNKLQKK